MKFAALAALVSIAPLVSAQAGAWQQCGGQSWTGTTTCVSGYSCSKINDYYSQCIPGTATTTAGPTSTAPSTPGSTSSTLPYVVGLNMAGYDFSVATDGSFKGTGVDPPTSQFSHFARQGVNIFRIPFAWQLMTPTVGGTVSQTFLSRYDATVQTARSQSTNPWVVLDLHNYARWNGQIIGQGGPTNAQYASLWSQLATKYKNDPKIIFGIMNEPHDVPNLQAWADSVQAVVNAIRSAGATSQYIIIPGSSWSSAAALPNEAGPYLLKVTDPAGGTSKLIFDVHKYLDSDNSGTHPECTTNNVDTFTALYNWLKTNNRQAILTESGGGATSSSCFTALNEQLAFIKSHQDRIVGFTAWSAGAFDTTYVLTLTPNGDQDQPLWTNAIKPNLP